MCDAWLGMSQSLRQQPAPQQPAPQQPAPQQPALPQAAPSPPQAAHQQQQPHPSPTPSLTTPSSQKSKGIKLKNAALARLPKERQSAEDGADAGKGEGERALAPGPVDEEPPAAAGAAPAEPSPRPEAAPVEAAPQHSAREPPERPAADALLAAADSEAAVEEAQPLGGSQVQAYVQEVLSLKPTNGIFDRTLMLRIWRSHKHAVHEDVRGLHTNTRPGEKPTPVDRKRRPPQGVREGGGVHDPTDRSQVFGTDMKTSKGKKEPLLKVSDKGYRIHDTTVPPKREDEIERRVRSLLNKICPDNLKVIVERLALIELHKAEELEFVIKIIFGKALAEPHYCETYADMVFALRNKYPEFAPEQEGEKAHTFTRVLLNTCQNEFENLPTSFEPTDEERALHSPEDLRLEMTKRKNKMLANMKFIGNLFLRQLLAVKVIGQVVHDLIGIKDGLPEEHMIECVCELLHSIGFTLDATSHGKMLMSQFAHRLQDLKRSVLPDGKSVAFSKRIQFQIQNLLELRGNAWQKKLFKEQAKTKEEVRRDAAKEARQQAKGAGAEIMFSTATAGMRPAYIDDFKNQKPQRKPALESSAKPEFTQAYVKKVFQYFAEDKSGEVLETDWNRAQPTAKEAKQGIDWLCEIGFNDSQKEDVIAETITELINRRVVGWDILCQSLGPFLESLEDMLMDVPTASLFVHSLFSRLLFTFSNRDFNTAVLKTLPMAASEKGGMFAWQLLVGAFRKLKERGGPDAVQKALAIGELSNVACKARKCTSAELRRYLQEEGAL